MINIELFERVKERILREPRNVDMGHYLYGKEIDGEICGTVGCIAGHAVMECYRDLKLSRVGNSSFFGHNWNDEIKFVFSEAKNLLGLSEDQALTLFIHWPDSIEEHKPGTLAYAEAVVRWIDECLNDWKDEDAA